MTTRQPSTPNAPKTPNTSGVSGGSGVSGRSAAPLAAALARGPLVLDGGLSNQLESQGCDLADVLWSARLLADEPDQVAAAHAAYLAAGAQVLITSSYQATYEGFGRKGIGRRETTALLGRSVRLARRAADGARSSSAGAGAGPVWVAGSVGPYGAMLADGGEYRGRYGLGVGALERFHRPRVEALAAADPDVLALETVPDVDEAEAMLRAVEGCGVPVWLSYTISGETTRAGQPLPDAFALADGHDQVIAVGVNCCDPADARPAVEVAAQVTGKPVVVYPNSGEGWDADTRSWRGPSRFTADLVAEWLRAGARLVGGCCRVGPDRIAEVAAAVRAV